MAGPIRWNPLRVLAGQGNCSSGQPARNWGSLASGWGGLRTPAAPRRAAGGEVRRPGVQSEPAVQGGMYGPDQ